MDKIVLEARRRINDLTIKLDHIKEQKDVSEKEKECIVREMITLKDTIELDDVISKYVRNKSYLPEKRYIGSNNGVLFSEGIIKHFHEVVARRNPLLKLITHYYSKNFNNKVSYTKSNAVIKWLKEGEGYGSINFKDSGIRSTLKKIGAEMRVHTNTLENSIYPIDEIIYEGTGTSIGDEYERAIIDGDGVKQFRGFLLDCLKHNISNSIIFSDITNIFNKLNIKYLASAAWLINPTMFTKLINIADDNGNQLLTPSTNINEDPDGYMMGKPCYITAMPDTRPIAFGDFSFYTIIENSITLKRLNETYILEQFIGYLVTAYADGALIDSDSIIAAEII